MDLQMLEFRAACIQAARNFFIDSGFLELDTPALADALIPESCLEVFRTEYLPPFNKDKAIKTLFLTPSPEVYIKPLIAAHKRSVFQLSKCYRNVESTGKIHSPEFTMLEYYLTNADYTDSVKLTERFFLYLAEKLKNSPAAEPERIAFLRKPFLVLTMDEAFRQYAGFSLAAENTSAKMAEHANKLGLGETSLLEKNAKDDLYELIFVHAVEPELPKNRMVILKDYPAFAPCLAKDKTEEITVPLHSCEKEVSGVYKIDAKTGIKNTAVQTITWKTKERWELYAGGIELANCYTEARSEEEVDRYFEEEDLYKQKQARVPHPAVKGFGNICKQLPPCSGTAMGFDRLIMFLAGKSTIESIMHTADYLL